MVRCRDAVTTGVTIGVAPLLLVGGVLTGPASARAVEGDGGPVLPAADRSTGEVLWRHDGTSCVLPVAGRDPNPEPELEPHACGPGRPDVESCVVPLALRPAAGPGILVAECVAPRGAPQWRVVPAGGGRAVAGGP